jgi:hypothetical protein
LAISSELKGRIDALAQELQQAAREETRSASKSYYSSQTMLFVSLGCSLAAAIIGLGFAVHRRVVGGIAALPPLIAFVASNFRLEVRQNWYYRKAVALDVLRSRLLYQLPEEPTAENVSAIAAARDKLVTDMQKMVRNDHEEFSCIQTTRTFKSSNSKASLTPKKAIDSEGCTSKHPLAKLDLLHPLNAPCRPNALRLSLRSDGRLNDPGAGRKVRLFLAERRYQAA